MMNKKVIRIQKAQNVIKPIILIIFLFNATKCIAQKSILGTYYFDYKLKYSNTSYNFNEDGTFEFKSTGDLGITDFGKGHYETKNDSLYLNYDLTELNYDSYHKSKHYYNSNDSILIKVNVFNMKNEPLPNIQVLSLSNRIGARTDSSGTILFKLKKEKRKDKLEIHLDGEYYTRHILYLNYDINYEIDVFLSKTVNYGFSPKFYKNFIEKYRIIEISNNFIKLQLNNKQVIKLNKQE